MYRPKAFSLRALSIDLRIGIPIASNNAVIGIQLTQSKAKRSLT